jgi:hypothetical protein
LVKRKAVNKPKSNTKIPPKRKTNAKMNKANMERIFSAVVKVSIEDDMKIKYTRFYRWQTLEKKTWLIICVFVRNRWKLTTD